MLLKLRAHILATTLVLVAFTVLIENAAADAPELHFNVSIELGIPAQAEGLIATVSAAVDASDGSSTVFTIQESAPWLEVTPHPFGAGTFQTPQQLRLKVYGTGLEFGLHTAILRAEAPGYVSSETTVTLRIGEGDDLLVADPSYVPTVDPTYPLGEGPKVLFHQSGGGPYTMDGKYAPLVSLLEADGYQVVPFEVPFAGGLLLECDPPDPCTDYWYGPELQRTRLMIIAEPENGISTEEVAALVDWISYTAGGILFVSEDPNTLRSLMGPLGLETIPHVIIHEGSHCPQGLPECEEDVFGFSSFEGSLEPEHPSVIGFFEGDEVIGEVTSYRGPALVVPTGLYPRDSYQEVMAFGSGATYSDPNGRVVSAVGASRAVGISIAFARAFVALDTAMFSALATPHMVYDPDAPPELRYDDPVGLAAPGAEQNEAFVLNLVHWLEHLPEAAFKPKGDQRVDPNFVALVEDPEYDLGSGPLVLVDSAHGNFHTIDPNQFGGKYVPFGDVLAADGYQLADLDQPLDQILPHTEARILVIANAFSSDGNALSGSEVESLVDWLRSGGSLFLIADHHPFSRSYDNLSSSLGIEFVDDCCIEKGAVAVASDACVPWIEPDACVIGAIRFSRSEDRLSFEGVLQEGHPIAAGRSESESVSHTRVSAGTALTLLGTASTLGVYEPVTTFGLGAFYLNEQGSSVAAEGLHQDLAIRLGLGRIFVASEASQFTAQTNGRFIFGLHRPEAASNQQYLLNIVHWLDGRSDLDSDGIYDQQDNCPLVSNVNQFDGDGDGVGDACDNCLGVHNPRLGTLSEPARETFQTQTGGQLDDDGDGYGNACDGDFDGDFDVDQEDLGLLLGAVGVPRESLDCPGGLCARFDLDGRSAEINTADLLHWLELAGGPAAERCSRCPIECVAGDLHPDMDGDGIRDVCDNCPAYPNPNQLDGDADGIGDVCEPVGCF